MASHCSQGVSLAVDSAGDLEVVVGEDEMTVVAREASRVILSIGSASCIVASLEVLTFDTTTATMTNGAVLLVVMLLAEWLIVDHVEVCSRKWLRACLTCETLLVPASRQTTICRFD